MPINIPENSPAKVTFQSGEFDKRPGDQLYIVRDESGDGSVTLKDSKGNTKACVVQYSGVIRTGIQRPSAAET